MSEDIEKAESQAKSVTRPLTREKGQPGISNQSRYVREHRRPELATLPKALCAYDKMYEDDAVYNSIDITNKLVTTALYNGKFVSPSGKLFTPAQVKLYYSTDGFKKKPKRKSKK